jgi:hypothetical protein
VRGDDATRADQILDFISRFPGRDDDEIARLLKISQRQTVNIICRRLADNGRIRRAKGATGMIETDVEGEVAPRPNRPPLTAEQLLRSGFKLSAEWKLNAEGALETDHPLPTDKGVYAFVKEGLAVYVGVASMGLRKRLYFYAKPGVTQVTSRRLNAILSKELTNGTSISIYTACPPDLDCGT